MFACLDFSEFATFATFGEVLNSRIINVDDFGANLKMILTKFTDSRICPSREIREKWKPHEY